MGLAELRLAKAFPGLVSVSGLHSSPDDREDYSYVGDDSPCCIGGANDGPRGCTCWTPVYDLEQADPDLSTQPTTRETCCSDCAYRNGSPEREDGYGEELLDIAGGRETTFYCHVGLRRVAFWRHPNGRLEPGDPADYRPPQLGTVVFKADGSPAERCAGWAAHRRALLEVEP